MRTVGCITLLVCIGASFVNFRLPDSVISVPRLERAPVIDGDLSDWKDYAWQDGVWDIYRVQHESWYQPGRNRLTDHGNEPSPADDLQARYYMAWDSVYLYFGAEVLDNVNDVSDPAHEPKRWYYKDCVCLFIEAPADTLPESFGRGDNAFCFIADKNKPSYGAWWRHGTKDTVYVEESLPRNAGGYALTMRPVNKAAGSFVLEAKVDMARTLGKSDPSWQGPRPGDEYRIEIVHTDPDGGDYGGHLIIYGTGDNDRTWRKAILSDPVKPVTRKLN